MPDAKLEQEVLVTQGQLLQEDEAREKYYEEMVLPHMVKAAEMATQQLMPFVLGVGYSHSAVGEVGCSVAFRHPGIDSARVCLRSAGNLDKLLLAIVEAAIEHGHNSNLLEEVFKIPKTPADAAKESTDEGDGNAPD